MSSNPVLPPFPASDVLIRLDRELRIQWIDQSWTTATKYESEESIGKLFGSFMLGAHRERWSRHVAHWEHNRITRWSFEFTLHRKNLDPAAYRIEANVAFDERGIVGAAAVLRALDDAEATLGQVVSSIAEHAADAIIVTEAEPFDLPGPRIVYVNPAFEAQTGYLLSEVVGKTPRILQGPETNADTTRALGQALRRWEPASVELLNYRKDGTEFWVELSAVPVADETGWYTHWVAIQRDVSLRKEIQERLLQSEDRFRTIVENLPGVVYRCSYDRHWTTLYMSDYSKLLTGYDRSEFESGVVSFRDVVHPDDVDLIRDSTAAALDSNEPFEVRYRVIHQNGDVRWVQDRGRISVDPETGAQRIDGVMLDITDERVREERLELMEAAVHDATESILITDATLDRPGPHIIYVNPGFERMTGYEAHEVLGRSPRILQGPSTDESLVADLRVRLESGRDFFGETINYRKDGTPFAIEWSISEVRTSRNETRFVAVQRDVTERREAEAHLRMLQAAMDNARDAVVVLEALGGCTRVAYVNQSYTTLTGRTIKSLDEGCEWIRPSESVSEDTIARVSELLAGSDPGTLETEILNACDIVTPVECVFSPVPDRNGLVSHWVVIQRDLTESRRMEAEREARERAEEMVRMRSSFLNNMSHEIRTPITGILGAADILEMEVDGPAAEFVHMIKQNGRRLFGTLDAVLQVARLDGDGYLPQEDRIDIEVTLAPILSAARSSLVDSKVDLEVELAAATIHSDGFAVSKIAEALIDNAVKFTMSGSINVTWLENEASSELVVADTGIGMSSEFLSVAADDFRQESEGLDRRHEGSGMGLALARRFAEKIGAEIKIESEKGVGTVCRVVFPRAYASQAA
jgi:PAS domain S-box-containing protein